MAGRDTQGFSEPLRATERMALAWRQTSFSRRTWFAVTLALIFALHASILAVLLWRDDQPVPAPQAEETPVEVVAQMPEPAKPPPTQASKPPQPSAPPPPEKPATSAPRAQNDETVERDAGESESHQPKAKQAPADAAPPPTPSPAAAAPAPVEAPKTETAKLEDAKADPKAEAKLEDKELDDKGEPKTADTAAAPPPDPAEAEALDKAPPEPPRRPAEIAAAPPPKPAPKPVPKPVPKPAAAKLAMAAPRSLPTPIDQLAGASDLPDYVFAKPQRKPTKSKGGTEDNRYLAVVYAMVTENHEAIPLPDGDWQVAVAFQVDGHGDLIGIGLTQSSGYPSVDAAAIAAVRRAAPFPPPPSGGVTGLIARLSAAHARAAMARSR